MLSTIVKASENFCIHQIRVPYEVNEGVSNKRTLIAYIDIDTDDAKKFRVYIASDFECMQSITTIFIEEDESDEETLIDMLLETTNLIVGSAKVLAEEANENTYTIQTPHFLKVGEFDYPYDEARCIKLDNKEMILAIKEIDE